MERGAVSATDALAVTPQPSPFDFVLGDRAKRYLHLHNPSCHVPLHFKIQCTASSRFRLQPSKGVVGPQASVVVQIQLSAQTLTESDCVFLVLAVSSDADDSGDVWKLASPSMISKQYISSRIVAVAPDISEDDLPRCHPSPLPEPAPAALASPSHIITLLIKNRSRHPTNQLTADDVACLRHYKLNVSPDEWSYLMAQAIAQRKQLQHQRRHLLRAPSHHLPPHMSLDHKAAPSLEVLSPPDSPVACSDMTATSFDGLSLRDERQRSGSFSCSSTCESGGGDSTVSRIQGRDDDHFDGARGRGEDAGRGGNDAGRGGSDMWTRYMLDVCVQQLAHIDETCSELTISKAEPEKVHAKLVALRRSVHTLVDLCRRNPFLHGEDGDLRPSHSQRKELDE